MIDINKKLEVEKYFSIYIFPKKSISIPIEKENPKYLFRLNNEGEKILKTYWKKTIF